MGTLFQALWRSDSDRLILASQERGGIRYLIALGSLTTALVDAESAAATGRSVPTDAVSQAIQAVDAVDGQVGAGLTTTERWTDLRGKIQTRIGRSPGDRIAAYDSYVDITNLLLALYAKVSRASHLSADPGADTFFLQDAVSNQLPATIIGLGRLADLAALAPARPAGADVETAAGLVAGRDAVISTSDAVTEDFLLAVAITDSRTLSKAMLGDIDAFRLVTDKVEASTALADGHVTAADAAEVGQLRADGLIAGTALTEAVTSELDRIIATRQGSIAVDRNIALAAGSLGVLLALMPIVFGLVGWRRSTRHRTAAPPPDAEVGGAASRGWSADQPQLVPVGGREPFGAAR